MLIEKILYDFIVQEQLDNKFVLVPDREDEDEKKYNEDMLEGTDIIVEVFGEKKDDLDELVKKHVKDNIVSKPVGTVCVDAGSNNGEAYELYAFKMNIDEKFSVYHFVKSGNTKEISYIAYAKIIKKYSSGITVPISELLTWPIVIRDNTSPPNQGA